MDEKRSTWVGNWGGELKPGWGIETINLGGEFGINLGGELEGNCEFLVRRYVDHDGSWRGWDTLPILMGAALVLLLLHFVEVTIWALSYLGLPAISRLESLEQAVYFSLVTFTSLGYGGSTLDPEWRVLSGLEAMNGILLFGWSTALLFAVVQRSWKLSHH